MPTATFWAPARMSSATIWGPRIPPGRDQRQRRGGADGTKDIHGGHRPKLPEGIGRWRCVRPRGDLAIGELNGALHNTTIVSGTLMFTDGPYVETKEWLGGLTVVDVADEETARMWAGKIAEACGWPQEVRRFKPRPATR